MALDGANPADPDPLRKEMEAKNLDELKVLARRLGVPHSGARKAALIQRLLQSDRAALTAGLESSTNLNPPPVNSRARLDQDRDNQYANRPPPLWERICAFAIGILTFFLIAFLAIRNEPFKDQGTIIFLRIFISLSVAILGATIPGFLSVRLSYRNQFIRAGGALALFVLTLLYAPRALPNGQYLELPETKLSLIDAVNLRQTAINDGNWPKAQQRILNYEIKDPWEGVVVSSDPPGYVVQPNKDSNTSERDRVYISLADSSKHVAYPQGRTIFFTGLVSKFDKDGIDVVGAELKPGTAK